MPVSIQSDRTEATFRSHNFLLVVAAFIALVLSVFFYIRELESLLTKRTIDELSRTSNIITSAFQNRIQDRMEILEALSIFIAKHESVTAREVLETLNEYSQRKGYLHLAVIEPSGLTFTSEGTIHPSGDQDFFLQGMRGKRGFTGPSAGIDGKNTITISIPIRRGKEILGVLYSVEPVQAYKDFLGKTVDKPGVRSAVINPDGTIIASSSQKVEAGGNLYAELAERRIVGGDELYQILLDLKAGRNRLIRDTSGKEEQFTFFNVALDEVYIVASIPVSYEESQLSEILKHTVYLMLALALFFLGLMIYILRFRSAMSARLSHINRELQSVIANTPGGTLQTRDDADQELHFVSDGFLALSGYRRKELREEFGNSYLRMLNPEDLDEALHALNEQLQQGDDFALEYRLRHKAKGWIWVLQKGRRVTESGQVFIYSTLVDVSESKQLMEQSMINAESFRQLLDISGNSLFDFDPGTGVVTFSARFSERYGWPATLERFPQSALDAQLIHEDDVAAFLGFIDKMYDGYTSSGAEFRLRDREGYSWCSVAATVVFDKNNVAVKIVGKVEDIDQQKRSLVALEEKTQRDSFTGLYNKISSGELIAQCLSRTAPGSIGALFIIDADNFKSINDTLGHPVGDQVIKDLAGELCRIFRSTDIVGRLGGDEFIAYMHNTATAEQCQAKAAAVCAAFRRTYGTAPALVSVSASVGVALYPADGGDYRSLYQQADKALYQAKRQGKNQYVFA